MSLKSINFCNKPKSDSKIVCHSIPCKLETDCKANVDQYFEPTIRQSEKDNSVLLSSFRGRPLVGRQIDLPQDCSAFIIKDSKSEEFVAKERFDNIIEWNLDKTPSESDSLPQLCQWIQISEAIHSSVESKQLNANKQ